MAHYHPTEPIATFELMVPAHQIEQFFEALSWQTLPRPPVPPTLATVFRHGELLAIQKLNVKVQNILHTEQKYRFLRDLQPDSRYQGETFLMSHYEKSGRTSTMSFYTLQTNVNEPSGERCIEAVTTIIVRETKDA